MALDGAFLYQLKKELEQTVIGARVEKVYQPSREEIVLFLRGRNGSWRLLLSARANSARIHLTSVSLENPAVPPMFCMLLRKRLNSAKLAGLRQPELERLLMLDFECVNELGDLVLNTLVIEIMGRYSNIILVDEHGDIVDSVKRVDQEMSSARLVLPGVAYERPPAQNKISLLEEGSMEKAVALIQAGSDTLLSKALLNCLQGLSPIICREIQARVGRGDELRVSQMTEQHWERLAFFLKRLREWILIDSQPVMVSNLEKKPIDFSFLEIIQYGLTATTRVFHSFSEMLDAFYAERDSADRIKARSMDLLKFLTTAMSKLSRKINVQRAELAQCEDREQWRIYGDLLNANLYRLERGPAAVVENYFAEGMPQVRIPMDPALSPAQNAQRYYKDYRRAQTAEQMLKIQIKQAEEEIRYLETVFDALSRAATERDLAEIRQELIEQGYLKKAKGKQKPQAPSAPLRFQTSDGCLVLVGRNNRQNDQLTLRTAKKQDIWFHTKNIPGSHVILSSPGKEISEQAVLEAAEIAAFHSHAGASSQVPVDYTTVRNVRKPQGAKPGMVIYDSYQTVYVTPEKDSILAKQIEKK